jgi:hypothetical protein
MPKSQKVVEIKKNKDMILATCLNCHGTNWYIHMNALGKDFSRITKFQCSNPDCGMSIEADIEIKFG